LRNVTQAAAIFNRDNEARTIVRGGLYNHTRKLVRVQFAKAPDDNGGVRRHIKGELPKQRPVASGAITRSTDDRRAR